jgi:hypothetical protein
MIKMDFINKKRDLEINNFNNSCIKRRRSNMKHYMTVDIEIHKRLYKHFQFITKFDDDCFSHHVKHKNVFFDLY